MSEPTEPNFEQRITAHERGLLDELYGLFGGFLPTYPNLEPLGARRAIAMWLHQNEQSIREICAIARDYARRPEGEE